MSSKEKNPPVSMQGIAFGHKRAGSHEKKKKQRDSLGSKAGEGSRSTSGGKTHLLVVQGGIHDAWQGDFLALVKCFRDRISPQFAADFWTIYGPKEWFASPESAGYNDIKFGEERMASRFNSTHYEDGSRFTTWNSTEICEKVFQWIGIRSDPINEHCAKAGDSIIIIILAHGRENPDDNNPASIRLGNNDMLVTDFVEALRKIPRNVQVNVLSNACFSAAFAEGIANDKQVSRWIQASSKPGEPAFPAERSASGRFRNSPFVASKLVKSLASIGAGDPLQLSEFISNLNTELQANPDESLRTVGYTYTDAPLSTQVHALLLRKFADFPLTSQNTAARRRQEMDVHFLARPVPSAAKLIDKASFAEVLIKEEHHAFGSQTPVMKEEAFEKATRNHHSRIIRAGGILQGMMLRVRMQAAVLNCFLQLCVMGVCSLHSLEYPMNWHSLPGAPGSLGSWIVTLLNCFAVPRIDWDSTQKQFRMPEALFVVDYRAPVYWLAVMIGRSFTSLSAVFDVIRVSGHLGLLNTTSWTYQLQNRPLSPEWEADINFRRISKKSGSGTFAMWLPEEVDAEILNLPYDEAAQAISTKFWSRVDHLEQHYCCFFDMRKETMDTNALEEERDVRDWKPALQI